jgi:peptidyl-prolyl cis-trans isomerase SurA
MNLQDFFILPLFTAVFFAAPAHAEVVERLDAVINKTAIYMSDVTRFRDQVALRAKVDPIFTNEPIAKKPNPSDYEVVSFLIDDAIILDKFPIPDADVEQEINTIQANLKIDRDQLRAAILREGFKFEDYFRLMRVSLAKRQLIDRDIRSKAVVSEDDLRSEYNREKSTSSSFEGSFHLFLQKIPKKDYNTAALAKDEAQRELEAIKKGAAFTGEDLGYLAYGDMSEALQKVVQKLGPEKMSGVVEDTDSFMIVKTGDIKNDIDSANDREKDQLRSRLMDAEFQHQIHLWLEHERANNFVKINIKPT